MADVKNEIIIKRCAEVLHNTHDGEWLTERELSCLQWLCNNYTRLYSNTVPKALYDLTAMEQRAMADPVIRTPVLA